jgi:ATP-binding protein involved in chromosome partitioning
MRNLSNIIKEVKDLLFNNGYKLSDLMSRIIQKNNGDIGFSIDITNVTLEDAERIKKIAEKKLLSVDGIKKITIIFTNEKSNKPSLSDSKKKIIQSGNVIIVGSGKGGVGKSTYSLALAKKLQSSGKSVGIIDLDIHGPSIPTMIGINQKIEINHGLMVPIEFDNIKIMSIGFLVGDLDAIAWRGPMISKTLYQLLFLTLWGKIDYLIIDTPPGTGDIHITLLEKYEIDGLLIITTPDKLSVSDVKKTISLYKKFDIHINGIIENNSFFICPDTQRKFNLFGEGGGQELSLIFSIPLLDKIPIIHDFNVKEDFNKIISDNVINAIISKNGGLEKT